MMPNRRSTILPSLRDRVQSLRLPAAPDDGRAARSGWLPWTLRYCWRPARRAWRPGVHRPPPPADRADRPAQPATGSSPAPVEATLRPANPRVGGGQRSSWSRRATSSRRTRSRSARSRSAAWSWSCTSRRASGSSKGDVLAVLDTTSYRGRRGRGPAALAVGRAALPGVGARLPARRRRTRRGRADRGRGADAQACTPTSSARQGAARHWPVGRRSSSRPRRPTGAQEQRVSRLRKARRS